MLPAGHALPPAFGVSYLRPHAAIPTPPAFGYAPASRPYPLPLLAPPVSHGRPPAGLPPHAGLFLALKGVRLDESGRQGVAANGRKKLTHKAGGRG